MLKRVLIIVGALVLVAVAAGLFLTWPKKLPASVITASYTPDLANGEAMFHAGNCSACHMTQGQDDRLQLAGPTASAPGASSSSSTP
jgi:mono/diheme cytochrome c family protein